ncbi:uncharacterized protein LOC135683317 [Rhopilema esculentum]|uniref:uncharacterized protein LOC135683317 n=1 Tax=Rhopilema esculentum TaxID=499914 RepID=UPI0031D6E256
MFSMSFISDGQFLSSSNRHKMVWNKEHDILLCREILVTHPYQFKHGSRKRGQCWGKIANALNLVERPKFLVDQRSVRDQFTKLERDFKRKIAMEARSNGIPPDEPSELDRALDEIVEQSPVADERILQGVEKEKVTAGNVRRRAMENLSETRDREELEGSMKRKRTNNGTVDYLEEKSVAQKEIKMEKLELKKRKLELQEKGQKEAVAFKRK